VADQVIGDHRVLINGIAGDSVSAADRGLHYGDGLFETLAVLDGEPLLWERHYARLRQGCERLGIPSPDPSTLRAEADQLCAQAGKAVLKIIVTRGPGGRGYRPPELADPTRILSLHPYPDYPAAWPAQGVSIRLCQTRLGRNPALAGIKHCNRLEQVLARAEWADPGIAEGIMLDLEGQVIEGTMSNIYMIYKDILLTPSLDMCGVAGVIRERVLELAEGLGVRSEVRPVSVDELRGADEVFLSNSVIGIWPVARLVDTDGREFPGSRFAGLFRHELEQRGAIVPV
jgi:4-amino-4-deoxychorismate lyase